MDGGAIKNQTQVGSRGPWESIPFNCLKMVANIPELLGNVH